MARLHLSPRTFFKWFLETLPLLIGILLSSRIAIAQAGIFGRGGPGATGIAGTLTRTGEMIFQFFRNDYTILFIVYVCSWAFFYLVYRIGLEQSHRIPPQYCSRLATIISLITITPLFYALQQSTTVHSIVENMMQGWFGVSIMILIALILYIFSYFSIRHYLSPLVSGGP